LSEMNKNILYICTVLFILNNALANGVIDKDFNRNNIENLNQGKHEIILTFDDGPTPGVTEKILDTLKKYNLIGTFFIIGNKAVAYPHLMKRIAPIIL